MSSGGSFTAMSSRLAIMIREIHGAVCKGLDAENRPTTLVQIIKCIVVLVANTPYEKMQRGLLSSVASRLVKLYNSNPSSSTSTPDSVLAMQRVALSCLAAVISAVSRADKSSQSAAAEVSDLLSGSMLAQIMAELKGPALGPLYPELLRVVSAISGSFFDLAIPCWQDIFFVVLKAVSVSLDPPAALQSDPATLRLNAVKVIEDATASILAKFEEKESTAESFSAFWSDILASPILNLTTDRSSQVRSVLCNILAQIPAPIFAALNSPIRITCITLMLGSARDDSPVVRAQACRTLGVYILHSSLNIDPIFVTDVAESLVGAMKDPNLNVRIRACWSVGNLCDALVGLREGMYEESVLTEGTQWLLEIPCF